MGLDEEEFFLKFHNGHGNKIALRHYLPIAAAEIETKQKERLGAHTDFGTVTLLFQDDCGGLEVEVPGEPGKYMPAALVKNGLVMNIGDLLMHWSNGKFFNSLFVLRMIQQSLRC
jgi:isopenicillin N synthase-like dioxygenase